MTKLASRGPSAPSRPRVAVPEASPLEWAAAPAARVCGRRRAGPPPSPLVPASAESASRRPRGPRHSELLPSGDSRLAGGSRSAAPCRLGSRARHTGRRPAPRRQRGPGVTSPVSPADNRSLARDPGQAAPEPVRAGAAGGVRGAAVGGAGGALAPAQAPVQAPGLPGRVQRRLHAGARLPGAAGGAAPAPGAALGGNRGQPHAGDRHDEDGPPVGAADEPPGGQGTGAGGASRAVVPASLSLAAESNSAPLRSWRGLARTAATASPAAHGPWVPCPGTRG